MAQNKRKTVAKISVGMLSEDAKTFTISRNVYEVRTMKTEVMRKEREDAGGGAYWAKSFVMVAVTKTEQFVYDADGNCIGEIIQGSGNKFRDPNRRQIQLIG